MSHTPTTGRLAARHRVTPGTTVRLVDADADATPAFDGSKDEARDRTRALNERLEALQELLYAEGSHKVLIVLQAMDAGGKDGTIRSVFDGVNPQGVRVASFKKPTEAESAHDFLWRVHPHAPRRGEMVLFNRSHYEDVLVVRVHELAPEAIWRRRYEHINAFERLLADEGTTILKFFLHIGRDEQRTRLQERLDEPHKRWKFRRGDLEERAHWHDYVAAYEEAIERTSSDWAPWYVVPANRNWYRNLVVSDAIVGALDALDMRYPDPEEGLKDVVVE